MVNRFPPTVLAVACVVMIAVLPKSAYALPIFAHEYGLSCQKCHTAIPALSDFGRAFLANGYHVPASAPGATFPVAVKVNFLDTSAPGSGLPKAVIDEIELLTAGTLGPRANYFFEQYVLDGGLHGNIREAWVGSFVTSLDARIPIYVRGGQFTLPVPVDPESFRESAAHYAVFDQTIGANTFNFFDPKFGVSARLGQTDRGFNLELSALNGHDPQNGLPTIGLDTMAVLHDVMGPFDLSVYRYAGRRGEASDTFTRTGIGLRYNHGRWTSESVLQENRDANADGRGTAEHSSGGFTQLRYAITPKLFTLARVDGTQAATNGFTRSLTTLLGYRLSHNARVTLEDVLVRAPRTTHTFASQLTIAY